MYFKIMKHIIKNTLKFGSVLPHVFTCETINDLMKTEFEFNAQSKILINIVGLFSTFGKAEMRK